MRKHVGKSKRKRPAKKGRLYRQIWRVVDGAVMDAFKHHPNYLTSAGEAAARVSINKRVTGALYGYVVSQRRGVVLDKLQRPEAM